MSNMNNEELDAWLEEVEAASAEIKALTGEECDKETIKQVDKKMADRAARKQRELHQKERKEREALEKRKKGRFGKGEKENYTDFCKFCFREYELPTPKCLNCGNDTQPMKERREFLLGKAREYQTNKTRKSERQKKWELWQKTQAMVYSKIQNDYSKWDYYTSESESEDEKQDPIVPENDPQFKAMEKDMEERAKSRKEKRAKAEECKKKGNEYMAQENYEKAVLWYSEGLDLIKDYKPLYTNRALAWIKLGYFKKAIKDCTSVLDFCECFEDGYTKSRDFTFKAFIRRALARKERKEFRQAQEDVNESLKLIPKDKYAIQLKDEIEFLIQHKEKSQKILENKSKIEKKEQNQEGKSEKEEETEEKQEKKQEKPEQKQKKQEKQEKQEEQSNENSEMQDALNESESIQSVYMKIIDIFLKKTDDEIQEMELELLRYLFTNTSEEAKIYFYEKKGLQKLISLLKKDKNVFILLDILLRGNILYMTTFHKQEGTKLLYDKIENLLLLAQKKNKNINSSNYDQIEEIFEVLISMSAQDKIRDILKDSPLTITMVQNTCQKVLALYQKEVPMVSNYLKFLGNMLYQQSKVKDEIISNLHTYLTQLYPIFALDKKRSKYEMVREQAFTALANLLVENSVRDVFASGKYNELIQQTLLRISAYDLQQQPLYLNTATASLSFMVNLSFRASDATKNILNQLKVGEILYNRFHKLDYKDEKYKDLFFRLLQVLGSQQFNDPNSPLLEKKIHVYLLKFFDDYSIKSGFCNHAIRILATIFGTKENEIYLARNVEDSYFELITFNLKKLINQDDEMRFSNACTLAGFLSLFKPAAVNPKFNETIERLLKVCTDYTGNMRKSAAHLLGKIARYPANLDKIRKNHGIEILHSILQQVV